MDQPPPQIDPNTLAGMLREGCDVIVLDVREPWEFEICRIGDSRNIPLATLQQRLAELADDRPLVVVCHHGMRSLQAAAWLRNNGFDNAVNLAGGVDAWARVVEPGMATY